MLRLRLLSVVAGLVFAIAQTAVATIVQNGSFETFAEGCWQQYTTPLGNLDPDTGIPGWTLSQSDPANNYMYTVRNVYDASAGGPDGGIESLEFQGGWAYQDITLAAGTATVDFWAKVGANGNPDPLAVTLDGNALTIGGQTKITPTWGPAPDYARIWNEYTTDLTTVTAGTHRLQFTSDPYTGTVLLTGLDDVSVSNTPSSSPEPSTLMLLCTGLLSLLAYAWRRRR